MSPRSTKKRKTGPGAFVAVPSSKQRMLGKQGEETKQPPAIVKPDYLLPLHSCEEPFNVQRRLCFYSSKSKWFKEFENACVNLTAPLATIRQVRSISLFDTVFTSDIVLPPWIEEFRMFRCKGTAVHGCQNAVNITWVNNAMVNMPSGSWALSLLLSDKTRYLRFSEVRFPRKQNPCFSDPKFEHVPVCFDVSMLNANLRVIDISHNAYFTGHWPVFEQLEELSINVSFHCDVTELPACTSLRLCGPKMLEPDGTSWRCFALVPSDKTFQCEEKQRQFTQCCPQFIPSLPATLTGTVNPSVTKLRIVGFDKLVSFSFGNHVTWLITDLAHRCDSRFFQNCNLSSIKVLDLSNSFIPKPCLNNEKGGEPESPKPQKMSLSRTPQQIRDSLLFWCKSTRPHYLLALETDASVLTPQVDLEFVCVVVGDDCFLPNSPVEANEWGSPAVACFANYKMGNLSQEFERYLSQR